MNLQFMVKRFYDTSVKIIPEVKHTIPDYPKYVRLLHSPIDHLLTSPTEGKQEKPMIVGDDLSLTLSVLSFRWFEPFVIQWLNENDAMSMEYFHNALEKDRQTGVIRSPQPNAFDWSSRSFSFNKRLSIAYSLRRWSMCSLS